MVVDPETLAQRRLDKIAQLTVRRDQLQERAKQAQKRELWRIKALLVATERSLRWQLSHAGFSGDECGVSTGPNRRNNARAPIAPPA